MPDLHALDPNVLLGVATVLILVQTALVVGFLVPAGKASVLAGVLAGLGHLNPAVTFLALATASVLGAGVGYLLGRRYGEAVLGHRVLNRHADRIAQARDLVHRRAGFSLLAGRSIAILRATTPTLAGVVGVGVRRFAFFNVLGGAIWATVFVGSGFAGGLLVPGLKIDPTSATVIGIVIAGVLIAVFGIRSRGRDAVVPPPV